MTEVWRQQDGSLIIRAFRKGGDAMIYLIVVLEPPCGRVGPTVWEPAETAVLESPGKHAAPQIFGIWQTGVVR
jgi:hypothetical protein